jgi:hypothetical protein
VEEQADRVEEVVQQPAAVALEVLQAVGQATVEAGAAPVAALVVAQVAGQALAVQEVAQATAVPGPAIVANPV